MSIVECMEFPRETNEWFPLNIEINGSPSSAFKTAITALGVRPTTWTDAVMLDGFPGLMINGLTPGTYKIWIKVTATPQEIVVHVGNIVIT